MDEMKPKETAYSGERAPVAAVSAQAEGSAQASPAGTAGATQESAGSSGLVSFLEFVTSNLPTSMEEFSAFLKHSRRVWLMTAGIIIGAAVLVNLTARAEEWVKNNREKRQLHAIATLTPENLFARCGAAVTDETKEVYPVVMRTLTYQPRGADKLMISFSRTAEEKSDWVFLSLQSENGAVIDSTPEARIAALPCLDSKK